MPSTVRAAASGSPPMASCPSRASCSRIESVRAPRQPEAKALSSPVTLSSGQTPAMSATATLSARRRLSWRRLVATDAGGAPARAVARTASSSVARSKPMASGPRRHRSVIKVGFCSAVSVKYGLLPNRASSRATSLGSSGRAAFSFYRVHATSRRSGSCGRGRRAVESQDMRCVGQVSCCNLAARSPKRVAIVKKLEVSALVKRTYRVCVRVAVGVALALAVLVVVAALRLMAGPVDLDFLKARIAEAADVPGNDIRPDVDRISLEWGGISQPMRLVFNGLRFLNGQNQVIATAPTAALTFDPRSVFQGMLLPTSITIEKPSIEAEIDREGGMLRRIFADPNSQSQGEAVGILVEQLLAEPNYNSLIGQLDTIKIERAKLTLRDTKTGLTWVAPSARAELKRDAGGVIIAADARFSGGDPFEVSLTGVYARDRSRISVEAEVDGLKPSMFADLSPDAVLLRGVDIALSGRLRVEADGTGDIRHVAIDV